MFDRLFNLFGSQPKAQTNGARPQLESLETREVLSGNVTASQIGGDLVITGDSGHNTVEVYQIDNDSYRVRTTGTGLNGVYPPWWSSNGIISTTIHGVHDDIVINMGNGDDKVNLGRSLSLITTANDIWINTGAGNDTVHVNRVNAGDDLRLDGGTGTDSAYVYSSHMGGDTTHADLVFTGFDEDIIVRDTFVGRDLHINSSHALPGQEMLVWIDNVDIGDDLWIATGQGADQISIAGTHVADDTELFTGDEAWWSFGGDIITLSNSTSGDRLHVEAGDGNDRLNLNNYDAARGYLYGEGGNDDLNMDSRSSFSVDFFEVF